MSLIQKKIKIKPRVKLNHNTCISREVLLQFKILSIAKPKWSIFISVVLLFWQHMFSGNESWFSWWSGETAEVVKFLPTKKGDDFYIEPKYKYFLLALNEAESPLIFPPKVKNNVLVQVLLGGTNDKLCLHCNYIIIYCLHLVTVICLCC